MTEIEHEYTNEIVCPYCAYEYSDSWEFNEGNKTDGQIKCDGCNKTFNYSTDIEVTYITSKIECKEGQHDYHFETAHLKYSEMVWSKEKGKYEDNRRILPEEEWQFIEILKCSKCDNEIFTQIIPREEWIKKYPHDWERYQKWTEKDRLK